MQDLGDILYRLRKLCLKNIFKARPAFIMLLLVSKLALSGQSSPSREYQLKAVFLYNFTQFVEWPAQSFSSEQSPLVIGILGKDPFGSYLEETVAGEKINGHPLVVRRFDKTEDVGSCQVLFINPDDKKKTSAIIDELKGRNILTVSDTPDFLQQGGMIRFFTKKEKINLQVNLEAAKSAELIISSKLLRLVEIFTPKRAAR